MSLTGNHSAWPRQSMSGHGTPAPVWRRRSITTEQAFLAGYLIMTSGAIYQIFGIDTGAGQGGDIVYVGIWFLLYLVLFYFVLSTCLKSVISALVTEKYVVAYLLVMAVASLWSFDPGQSYVKLTMMATTVIFAFHVAQRDLVGFFRVFGGVMIAAWLLSLAIWAMPGNDWAYQPEGAVFGDFGGFRALFPHKNYLGGVTALGLLSVFVYWPFGNRYAALKLPALAAGLLVLVLARSANGLVLFAISMTLYTWLRYANRWIYVLVTPWIALLLVAAVLGWEILLSLLDRDATLTGRTELWSAFPAIFAAKPWLGYGYWGFFGTSNAAPQWAFVQMLPIWYQAPHIHSLYLQTAIDGGALALAALLAIIAATYANLRSVARLMPGPNTAFLFTAFTTVCVFGLVEHSLIHNHMTAVVFFVVVAVAHRCRRAERVRRARPSAPHRSDLSAQSGH